MTGRRAKELDDAVAYVGHGARGVTGDVASLADLDKLFTVTRIMSSKAISLTRARYSGLERS